MAKRATGEGTIYKRQDGRYEVALYMRTLGGIQKRIRRYARNHKEARAILAHLTAQAAAGTPMSDQNWRVGAYLDHWLATTVPINCRPRTQELYASVVRLYLKPCLGRRPITELGVAELQAFFTEQFQAGRSARLVAIMRTVLSAALTQAQREELIVRNPARLVRMPKWTPKEVHPWTPAQARQFLGAAVNDPLYPAFVLLVLYGLRRGEVLGIRWQDVDEEAGLLRVRQQIQRLGGALQQVPVKTTAGNRDLPLTEMARDSLIRRTVLDDSAPSGLVFQTKHGAPVEPHNLARSFQRIREEAGLPRITLHHLRHTTATMLKGLHVPVRDAQLILGHASPITTQQIYQHGDVEGQRKAIQGIEWLFAERIDGSRSRQMQPSKSWIWDLIRRFQSGGPGGARTRDTLLKRSFEYSSNDPLTGALEVVRGAARARLVGHVAVRAAVSFAPHPRQFAHLARRWLTLLEVTPGD